MGGALEKFRRGPVYIAISMLCQGAGQGSVKIASWKGARGRERGNEKLSTAHSDRPARISHTPLDVSDFLKYRTLFIDSKGGDTMSPHVVSDILENVYILENDIFENVHILENVHVLQNVVILVNVRILENDYIF